jgi:hypothetical protein
MSLDMEHTLRRLSGSPDHGPGFDQALWAAVAQIDGEGAAPSAAPSAPARWKSGRRRWVLLAAAAAVALAGAAVALSTRHVVQEYQHPQLASAATVMANVRHSLGSFHTLSATVVTLDAMVIGPDRFKPEWTSADWFAHARVEGEPAPVSEPKRIVASADGRLRTVSPVTGAVFAATTKPDGTVEVDRQVPKHLKLTRDVPALDITTFDDRTGVMSLYGPGYAIDGGKSGMRVEQAMLISGRPLGAPDLEGFSPSWLSTEGLTLSVLPNLAQGDVRQVTYEDRPALVVSKRVTPGPAVPQGGDGLMLYSEFDQIDLTVDVATWFPMRYTTLLHGDIVKDVRLTDVRLDVPVTASEFEPAFPAGAKVETDYEGFRRVSPAEAATAFRYTPLGAGRLPAGFVFSAAAAADKAQFFVMTGPGDADHEGWRTTRDVTQVQYRAGFLSFTVTTRPDEGMHDPLLADPFARDPGAIAARGSVHTVTIGHGALSGATARYALPAVGVPHLWAFHDGLLVTVSGDLTEEQLLQVAESLQPLK